jgi:hypothetical protein
MQREECTRITWGAYKNAPPESKAVGLGPRGLLSKHPRHTALQGTSVPVESVTWGF